jgi:hypothetical protein
MAVAQSLNTRNRFSIEQGMDLWIAYNRRLLQVSQHREVSMMCFDWEPQRYSRALSDLSMRLGLTPPHTGFDFFEASLRRNSGIQDHELPLGVRDLYLAMEAIAG